MTWLIGKVGLITNACEPSRRSAKSITAGDTVLNQDFKAFIQSLNDNQVRYLIVGGYALALHGHPRYTKDIDIWIEPLPDNADKTVRALEEFGFGSLGLQAADFLVPDQIIQLGYAPNRIDLLTTIPGVEFEASYATRIETTIDEIIIRFIDLEGLKNSKRAAGRLQDLADLENLG